MRFETGSEDRGSRLDVFLTRFLNDLTRSQIQSLNRRGAILVDGQREKSGYRIRGGEKIDVDPPAPEPLTIEAENIPLDVLYEDPDLAIVDKPAGLVVHPGAGTAGARSRTPCSPVSRSCQTRGARTGRVSFIGWTSGPQV